MIIRFIFAHSPGREAVKNGFLAIKIIHVLILYSSGSELSSSLGFFLPKNNQNVAPRAIIPTILPPIIQPLCLAQKLFSGSWGLVSAVESGLTFGVMLSSIGFEPVSWAFNP